MPDLSTFPENPTKQQVFDFVLEHLREQGEAAYEGGTCKYRTEDGKSCAVGCLISDDTYDSSMEGFKASSIILNGDYKLPIWMVLGRCFLEHRPRFLLQLQFCLCRL